MNAVVEHKEPLVPPAVARRGISESQWRALKNLFPASSAEMVVLAYDYCIARKLDPFKKPCHIVPMYVNGAMRDIVMPGIYELRTTAMRTGQYMGHSKAEYGPEIEHLGVKAPEWCSMTIYRWNAAANQRTEFPVTVYFSECVATKKNKETKQLEVNERWTKAPRQMMTKCTEAAGLREGFPDEIGGEYAAEEMEGQSFSQTEATDITPRIDPRGDTSGVDWELRNKHVAAITDILAEYGSDEDVAALKFREYIAAERLNEFQELWIKVHDKLAADGIISKSAMKKYQAKPSNRDAHA